MDRNQLLAEMDNQHILFGMFFAFSNRLQKIGDRFFEEITCRQFFLLLCLMLFKDNPPAISDLADVMGSSHQNIKKIADKLKTAGFIKIKQDVHDKRIIRIYPTEQLMKLSEKYATQCKDFLQKFFSGISDSELTDMRITLEKLESNLQRFENVSTIGGIQ